MWPTVFNLDVRIEVADGVAAVKVESPLLVGEQPGPPRKFPLADLDPSFTDGENLTEGRAADAAWLAQAGRRLFDIVFGTEDTVNASRTRLRRAVRVAATQGAGVRVRLMYDTPEADPHRLHELPWELLCDHRPGGDNRGAVGFPAVGPHTTLVRYLCQGTAVNGLRVPAPPVRVLFTDACPRVEKLDTGGDLDAIHRAEQASRGAVRAEDARDVSRSGLGARLARARAKGQPFHVWHHAGHGGTGPDNEFVLELDSKGKPEHVGVAKLLAGLQGLPDLRVAFLNVCHGGSMTGLATALAGVNVPAVIGHRTRTRDAAAVAFASAVYRHLFAAPVDAAVWAGRRDLMAAGLANGRPADWALPILFLRATEADLAPLPRPTGSGGQNPAPGGVLTVDLR